MHKCEHCRLGCLVCNTHVFLVLQQHASSEENLSLLNAALTDLAHNLQPHTEQRIDITNDDLINILAHPDVVRLASQKLLEQAGII